MNITREDGVVVALRVHFFGKHTNPDSESKKGFFVSLVNSKKKVYESNEFARNEDSVD